MPEGKRTFLERRRVEIEKIKAEKEKKRKEALERQRESERAKKRPERMKEVDMVLETGYFSMKTRDDFFNHLRSLSRNVNLRNLGNKANDMFRMFPRSDKFDRYRRIMSNIYSKGKAGKLENRDLVWYKKTVSEYLDYLDGGDLRGLGLETMRSNP